MSSYVNFYIKDIKRDDKFVYLDGYSRSSYIYDAFDEVKGENLDDKYRCKVLTFTDIETIESKLKERKEVVLNSIKELETKKEDIIKMNNSVQEKEYALDDIYESINAEKSELQEVEFSLDFYNVLWGVSGLGGNRVYAGIEGINPDGSEDNDNTEEGDK